MRSYNILNLTIYFKIDVFHQQVFKNPFSQKRKNNL